MERYLKKIYLQQIAISPKARHCTRSLSWHFVSATTMYLLSLGAVNPPAQAGSLLTGKYGYFRDPIIFNLSSRNQFINLGNQQDLQVDLSKKLDSLESAEKLNQQIEDYYQFFLDEPTSLTSEEAQAILTKELSRLATADNINQDIQARYQDIIDEDTEMIGMIETRELLLSEDNELGAELAEGGDVEQTIAMLQEQGLLDPIQSTKKDIITFPLPLLIGFLLIIASILAPIFLAVAKVLKEEVVEDLQEQYGKPKVPEKAVTLHNKTYRELKSIANRALRIADEKFGSEEFMLYTKIKKQVEEGINEYKTIGQSIRYLEVAIAAQSSFLKLESTELRFRSRKQQQFYNFVADTISDDIDKDAFRDLVKNKLAQIIPLLNSEEGRNALQSYLKEVNEISKHDLGLKLFSLFKKYQLDDFTILRTVSDITQKLESQDLFKIQGLTVLVLEKYEMFEKLAPIIGVPQEEESPETFAKMMQYMGLANRYSKAYQEFELLLKTLKKWEKPYKTVKLIREQYNSNEYRVPPQFSTELPGVALYEKYQNHFKLID